MEDTVVIEGQTFSLVRVQRGGDTAVYRGDGVYLRLGNPVKIKESLARHQQMLRSGFPVAEVKSEGEFGDQYYFIEDSLGDQRFGGEIFNQEVVGSGQISDETFARFLEITKRYAEAQIATTTNEKNIPEFAEGIHLGVMCDELPGLADALQARFKQATDRLADFPFAFTHGDFNPHNLYPNGVIDFEDSFQGPIGYDIVTNLFHPENFAVGSEYEYVSGYQFTEDQKQLYRDTFDSLYVEHNLPAISKVWEDLAFCRALWSASNMQAWPHLQRFRYDLIKSRFLS